MDFAIAYRWNGEQEADLKNFVTVPAFAGSGSASEPIAEH